MCLILIGSFIISIWLVTEYDSDTSCHYKMELSYENFFTSGPDPHPPAIADDESDDDDDDDIPRVRKMVHLTCHTAALPLYILCLKKMHHELFFFFEKLEFP